MVRPTERAPTPLKGRYLVRNWVVNRCLRAFDAITLAFKRQPASSIEAQLLRPKRILLCNGAHLGDVAFSTAVLHALKNWFPEAEIGMLVGSWSAVAIERHPAISKVHIVDHWRLNRAQQPWFEKLLRYRSTRVQALQEIRSAKYDVAIDLYYYFPNSVLLMWQADIPIRVGYGSAGFAAFLTHSMDWQLRDVSVVRYHADLLRLMGIPARELEHLEISLPDVVGNSEKAFADLPRRYVVIHPGTGAAFKEWPLASWRELASKLTEASLELVFTGAGVRERELVATIVKGLPGCHDRSNLLEWSEFVAVIGNAELVIGVDSIAAHLAAAMDVMSIVISTGVNNPHHWRPLSSRSHILTHPTRCAPCYRRFGCEEMTCLHGVSSSRVYDLALSLLRQ